MDWRRPETPRGQHRRGYSDRTSERSPHLVGARVVWEADGDEKLGLRRLSFFVETPWAIFSVQRVGAVGPPAAAAPVALPLEIDGSRL